MPVSKENMDELKRLFEEGFSIAEAIQKGHFTGIKQGACMMAIAVLGATFVHQTPKALKGFSRDQLIAEMDNLIQQFEENPGIVTELKIQ